VSYILLRHYRYEGYSLIAARSTEAEILADLAEAMALGFGDQLEAAELVDGAMLGFDGVGIMPYRTIRVVHHPRDADGYARVSSGWVDGIAPNTE